MTGTIIITGLEITAGLLVALGIICGAFRIGEQVDDATDCATLTMLSFVATLGVGLTIYAAALYQLGVFA